MKKQEKLQGDKKYKIGLTFGVFDLFHVGHLNLLKDAKSLCDTLIVCVSDDEYIEKVKGQKPIITFIDRYSIINSCKCVDLVDVQSLFRGKKEAIEKYKNVEVLFVGDDWNKKTYKGEGFGVPVVYLPHTPNISSTKIREKIKNML